MNVHNRRISSNAAELEELMGGHGAPKVPDTPETRRISSNAAELEELMGSSSSVAPPWGFGPPCHIAEQRSKGRPRKADLGADPDATDSDYELDDDDELGDFFDEGGAGPRRYFSGPGSITCESML